MSESPEPSATPPPTPAFKLDVPASMSIAGKGLPPGVVMSFTSISPSLSPTLCLDQVKHALKFLEQTLNFFSQLHDRLSSPSTIPVDIHPDLVVVPVKPIGSSSTVNFPTDHFIAIVNNSPVILTPFLPSSTPKTIIPNTSTKTRSYSKVTSAFSPVSPSPALTVKRPSHVVDPQTPFTFDPTISSSKSTSSSPRSTNTAYFHNLPLTLSNPNTLRSFFHSYCSKNGTTFSISSIIIPRVTKGDPNSPYQNRAFVRLNDSSDLPSFLSTFNKLPISFSNTTSSSTSEASLSCFRAYKDTQLFTPSRKNNKKDENDALFDKLTIKHAREESEATSPDAKRAPPTSSTSSSPATDALGLTVLTSTSAEPKIHLSTF